VSVTGVGVLGRPVFRGVVPVKVKVVVVVTRDAPEDLRVEADVVGRCFAKH
jgi:hypothetical protein